MDTNNKFPLVVWKISNFLFVLFILAASIFLIQCGSITEGDLGRVNAASGVPMAPDEGKVELEPPNYEIGNANFQYLQGISMPGIRIVFGNQESIELPKEAKSILNEHWKAAIKFFYTDSFNKSTSAQEAGDRDRAWTRFCNRTNLKLMGIVIQVPNGVRAICPTEAENLWGSLNRAAADIVGRANEAR